MPIIVTPQPYWSMVARLVQFDGRRALWRVAVGGLIIVGLACLALGGIVAGVYIVGDLNNAARVVMGAALGFAAPLVAERAWRRRWWRSLVERRLWSLQEPLSRTASCKLRRARGGLREAIRALRRAYIATDPPRPLPAPRPEAPELTYELPTRRPASQVHAGEDALRFRERVGRVLDEAGVEHVPHSHGTVVGRAMR